MCIDIKSDDLVALSTSYRLFNFGHGTQALYISFENLRAFLWPALAGTIIMAWNGLKIWHEIEKIIYQLCFQFKAGLFWLFWAKLKNFFKLCLPFYYSSSPSCVCNRVVKESTETNSCFNIFNQPVPASWLRRKLKQKLKNCFWTLPQPLVNNNSCGAK